MDIDLYVEEEEKRIEDDFAAGRISNKERSAAFQELYRDAQAALEQEAWDAFDSVMGPDRF